jgi:hypothetical protein
MRIFFFRYREPERLQSLERFLIPKGILIHTKWPNARDVKKTSARKDDQEPQQHGTHQSRK